MKVGVVVFTAPPSWMQNTVLSKIKTLSVKKFSVLKLESIILFKGFWYMYLTFSQVNWLENGSLSKFKVSVLLSKFPHFELWWAAIFEPIDLEKHYIPQRKALKYGSWNLQWLLEYLWFVRLQNNFSESSAFSLKRAWKPLRWCHAHFPPKF